LRIVWTDDAVANLEAIISYVSAFDPAAARTGLIIESGPTIILSGDSQLT
jgi:hypothetical protein